MNSSYTLSAVPVNVWLVFDIINHYFLAPPSLEVVDTWPRITALCRFCVLGWMASILSRICFIIGIVLYVQSPLVQTTRAMRVIT